jgi:hypothetical protein
VVAAVSFAAVLLGTRLHNHTNHTALIGIFVDLVILDNNFVVVVEKDVIVLVVLAEQEPRVVEGSAGQLIKNFLTSWQSIHQPFQTVSLFDATLDEVDRFLRISDLAKGFASLILAHDKFERRSHDAISEENTTQAFGNILRAVLGLTELERGVVVVIRDNGVESRVLRSVDRLDAVHVERNFVSLFVGSWGDTGQIEG